MPFWPQPHAISYNRVYIKGIRQHCISFYPVFETCYDTAEHEKVLNERKQGG